MCHLKTDYKINENKFLTKFIIDLSLASKPRKLKEQINLDVLLPYRMARVKNH